MDITEQEFTDICTCVGQIVIPYAQIETTIDYIVATVYHGVGGKQYEPELPRSLEREFTFLEKCFKKIEILKPFQPELTGLIAEIRAETEPRTYVVHGFFSAYDRETGTASFTLADAKKDKTMHTETVRRYTVPHLLQTGQRLLCIATKTQAFCYRLVQTVGP